MINSLYYSIIHNDIVAFKENLHTILNVNEMMHDIKENKIFYPLSLCCEHNRLQMVELLTDAPFTFQYEDNFTKHCFYYACIHNSIECVQHLVEKKIHIFQDPSKSLEYGLMCAVEKNHPQIVRYLVQSASDYIDLPKLTPDLFRCAVVGNTHDIMHYLLYSPELEQHADLYMNSCHIFRDAMGNNKTDNLHHLMHTYNIEYTPIIKEYLKYRIHPLSKLMHDTFIARDLKKQLEEELPIVTTNIKRNKI